MRGIGFAALVAMASAGSEAAADDDDSARELAAIQGSWTLVSSEVNGESQDDPPDAKGHLTVTNARYAVMMDGRQTSFVLKLEPTTRPKAIDLTIEDGPAKGQTIKGIYQIDDDRFTVCHGLTPRDDRPVEFSTGAESGHTLIVWRRTRPRTN